MIYKIQSNNDCFQEIVKANEEYDKQQKIKNKSVENKAYDQKEDPDLALFYKEKPKTGKQQKEKKQFRLRGKKLFLTYSNIEKQFTAFKATEPKQIPDLNFIGGSLEEIRDVFLNQFENILLLPKIKQYIIAEENHKDGNHHYHVFLEFKQKVDLSGDGCLDLNFSGFKLQGSYTTVRKKGETLAYISKHGRFIDEPKIPYLDGELFLNFKDYLIALYDKEGLPEVKKYLIENTEAIVKGGAIVLQHLEKKERLKLNEWVTEKDKENVIPSKYFDFPKEFEEWFKEGRPSQAIMIAGKSGVGKTEGIKSFLKSKNISFLLVRNIHGLREYDPQKHEAILFDDLFLERKLSTEQLIALGDTANHCDFRVIRDSVRIMAKTLRVFTSNDITKIIPPYALGKKQIQTRYFIVRIDKSLFNEKASKIDFGMNIRSADTEQLIAHNKKTIKLLMEDKKKESEEEFELLEKDFKEDLVVDLKENEIFVPPWAHPNFKDNYKFR